MLTTEPPPLSPAVRFEALGENDSEERERIAHGENLLDRIEQLRLNATTLSFSLTPAIEFNDLLADAESWANCADQPPKAVATTPTGGRLLLRSDWFTDADFARLKVYVERQLRTLKEMGEP